MNRMILACASLLLATTAMAASGSGTAAQTKPGDTAPVAQPGWVVVEEDWWYPLRLDSVDALNNARYYYRRDNEKAAATEIRKAASWMSYAASHAMPHTQQSLVSARTDLMSLADDLDTGKLAGAARMDEVLARASNALAEWHYYRAKEKFGTHEAGLAAQDLEAAAAHLENAARSAHFQYGPDTLTVFEDIYKDGKMVSEGKTIDNDTLGKHLDGIENAVETMAQALE